MGIFNSQYSDTFENSQMSLAAVKHEMIFLDVVTRLTNALLLCRTRSLTAGNVDTLGEESGKSVGKKKRKEKKKCKNQRSRRDLNSFLRFT